MIKLFKQTSFIATLLYLGQLLEKVYARELLSEQ